MGMKLHCAFSVDGAGNIVAHDGSVRTAAWNPAGTCTIELAAPWAIDATECVIKVQARDGVPSGAGALCPAYGVAHTDDDTKVITCVREPAGGGASAAASLAFDCLIFRLAP